MLRFASLGSGSKGNALLVENDGVRLLLDCGFGPREMAKRLERLGVEPQSVTSLLISHEHGDHVSGALACAARYGWRLYASHGAADAAGLTAAPALQCFDSHAAFAVDSIMVQPFPTPHDAREPAQFVFSDGARRLGVLTDAGSVTPHIVAMLDACDAIVLECNHDAAMLARGRYPPALKRRISGGFGHLDNAAAASLLTRVQQGRLQHVIAAHLSQENNRPQLAQAALAAALGCEPHWVGVADQQQGFAWRRLT